MLLEGPCASFGMLIHNEDEVRRLTDLGLRIVHSVDEVHPGEHLLIRAHGVPPDTRCHLPESAVHTPDC